MTEVIKANIADLKILREICIRAYSTSFAHHWIENGLELYTAEQFNENRLSNEVKNIVFDYFFIRKDGENIGFAKFKNETDQELSDLDNCEFEKLYVLPDLCGQGIGTYVFKHMIQIAKNRNKKQMYLCVIDTNENAIGLYKKLGFEYHSKTRLDAPFFREELRGMHRMVLNLGK